MLQRRPASNSIREQLTILADFDSHAQEAAIEFQDMFFAVYDLAGITAAAANDRGGNDVSE
jgi:hypothetical protein